MEINECPQCGAASSPSDRRCNFCNAEFFVTSLAYFGSLDSGEVSKYLKHYKELSTKNPDDPEGLLGLGLCYLQMGNYTISEKYFEKIIDISPDISQVYYYYILSFIKGRLIKNLNLKEIRLIESYLKTALDIDEGNPNYMLLLAIIKREYYEASGMKVTPPNANDILATLKDCQLNKNEIERLKEAVNIKDELFYFRNLFVTE